MDHNHAANHLLQLSVSFLWVADVGSANGWVPLLRPGQLEIFSALSDNTKDWLLLAAATPMMCAHDWPGQQVHFLLFHVLTLAKYMVQLGNHMGTSVA